MLKFVMVSPTEKAVSFRDNFDGASRSRDLVQKNRNVLVSTVAHRYAPVNYFIFYLL
jgi:hypothetical protein